MMTSNPTGYHPTEYNVLIEPEEVAAKVGSIYIPDNTKDQEKFAQIRGRIVSASPLAFSYASDAEWEAAHAAKPAAGNLVLYAKYAGVNIKGKDGKEYRLVKDKDICATIEE